MENTLIGHDIYRHVTGYMINAALNTENKKEIEAIQKKFTNEFSGAVWAAPQDSLHITLLDWIAPLVDYGKDKDKLFKEINEQYDRVISESLSELSAINIRFDTITVGRSAIFISGQDNGEFERIRQHFTNTVTLLPDTKLPPTIIHSTICRFTKEIDLQPLQRVASEILIDFTQPVSVFRLVRETIDPMLEFEVIKEYKLAT